MGYVGQVCKKTDLRWVEYCHFLFERKLERFIRLNGRDLIANDRTQVVVPECANC